MNRTFVFANGTKISFEPIAANEDIAGLGVFLSFAITSAFTILMAIVAYVIDLMNSQSTASGTATTSNATHDQTYRKTFQQIRRYLYPRSFTSNTGTTSNGKYGQQYRKIIERIVLGFSDQQLVTSSAFLIALRSQPVLSFYHFQVARDLLLLSVNIHILALIILDDFWKVHKMHGRIRMYAVLIVNILFVIEVSYHRKFPTNDISRLIVHSSLTLYVIGLFVYWVGVIGFHIMTSTPDKTPDWVLKSLPIFASLPVIVMLQGFLLSYFLWWIIRARADVKPFLDDSENKWGFGQVFPMVFIVLVFITTAEIWNEESHSTAKSSSLPGSGTGDPGLGCAADMQPILGRSSGIARSGHTDKREEVLTYQIDEAADKSSANLSAQATMPLPISQQHSSASVHCPRPEDEDEDGIKSLERPRRVDTEMGSTPRRSQASVVEADDGSHLQKGRTYPHGRQQH